MTTRDYTNTPLEKRDEKIIRGNITNANHLVGPIIFYILNALISALETHFVVASIVGASQTNIMDLIR